MVRMTSKSGSRILRKEEIKSQIWENIRHHQGRTRNWNKVGLKGSNRKKRIRFIRAKCQATAALICSIAFSLSSESNAAIKHQHLGLLICVLALIITIVPRLKDSWSLVFFWSLFTRKHHTTLVHKFHQAPSPPHAQHQPPYSPYWLRRLWSFWFCLFSKSCHPRTEHTRVPRAWPFTVSWSQSTYF